MMCAFLPPAVAATVIAKWLKKCRKTQKVNGERRRELFLVAKYRMTFDKMTSHRPDRKLLQPRDEECLSSVV
jgi:hypothetical protein